MAIPLPIETERLILRPFEPESDAEQMLEIYGDPAVMRYIPEDVYRSLAAVRATLERYAREQESRGFSFWAVVERAGGHVIGDAGFGVFAQTGDVELGYSFRRDRWGRGYATEAARACLDAALAHLDVARVVAVVDAENQRSSRVAERIGMTVADTVELHGRPHRLFELRRERAA